MFSPKTVELLFLLAQKDVDVTLIRNSTTGEVYADLHSQAKSHLHLYERDGELVFHMRYEMMESISLEEDVEALLWQAASCCAYRCICGRSFGSFAWDAICAELDITVGYGSM